MLHIISLKGRINRKKYLINFIYIFLLTFAMLLVSLIASFMISEKAIWFMYMAFAGCTYLIFANAVKRVHDIGKPTWLGALIIFGIQMQLTVGSLEIALSLKDILRLPDIIGTIFTLISLVVGLILLFKKGDVGPNKYGADPLGVVPVSLGTAMPMTETQTPSPEPTKIV